MFVFPEEIFIKYSKRSGGGRTGTFSPTSLRDNWPHPLSPPSKRPLPASRVQNSNKIKMRALCFAYNLVIYWSHGRGWLSFNSHCTEKDGMPANVNRNKSGTKNTTPRLRCQERIHQLNLFSGKYWYCAIHLSCSGEWYSAIYFSFSKASYCTVLPIYLVSSRKPQRFVLGLQDLASARACLFVCIPVLLRNFFEILVFA